MAAFVAMPKLPTSATITSPVVGSMAQSQGFTSGVGSTTVVTPPAGVTTASQPSVRVPVEAPSPTTQYDSAAT